jgi:hypothetical protein
MEKIKNIVAKTTFKKCAGVILIVLGLVLHLIPLFPAGWIIIVGLELLGIRLLLQDKIKGHLNNYKIYHKIKDIGMRLRRSAWLSWLIPAKKDSGSD